MPILTTLTVATLGGAAGGASKHLVESAIQSGKDWLADRYKGHHEKAIEKANEKASQFLDELAAKVARLEEHQKVDRSVIDRALEDPSFGALLQNALISSAQTESGEKHRLLASIVAGRLIAGPDSILTVASQMAASAVANCTTKQLHFLGFCASLILRWSALDQHTFEAKETFLAACREWFESRFAPYSGHSLRQTDIIHLEAVSCINGSAGIFARPLQGMLDANWKSGDWKLEVADLSAFPIGEEVIEIWGKWATKVTLTSIGSLIGLLVSDQLCNAQPTEFSEDWLS